MLASSPALLEALTRECHPQSVSVLGPLAGDLLPALRPEVLAKDGEQDAEPELLLVPGGLGWAAAGALLEPFVSLADSLGAPLPAAAIDGLAGVTATAAAQEARRLWQEDARVVAVPGLDGVLLVLPVGWCERRPTAASAIDALEHVDPLVLARLEAVEAGRLAAREQALSAGGLQDELVEVRARLEVADVELEAVRRRLGALAARAGNQAAGRPLGPPSAANDPRVDALAASHAAAALGALEDRVPVDRRGVLSSSPAELLVELALTGRPEEVLATLADVVDHADSGVRLRLVVPDDTSAELRGLCDALPQVLRIELGDAAAEDHDGPRLLLRRPVRLGPSTLPALRAAAAAAGRAVAALAAEDLAAPARLGRELLACALADAPSMAPGAGADDAACVLVPAGADPVPVAVACAAVVQDPLRTATATAGSLPVGRPEVVRQALADGDDAALRTAVGTRAALWPSVAYLLRGIPAGGSGGVHSVLQEAAGLRALGVDARVVLPTADLGRAEDLHPEAVDALVGFSGDDPHAALDGADVVVGTEVATFAAVREHVAARPTVVPAGYLQDYEVLFAPHGSSPADRALLAYRAVDGWLLFAKTAWVANTVGAAHGLPVRLVAPGLDRRRFHAQDRDPSSVLRVVAMVRPRTARRRARETARLLTLLQERWPGRVRCASFGCSDEELAAIAPQTAWTHRGPLAPADVADLLRESDVFVDLSTYQAFGRTGLEAMACGVVPFLPRVGGASSFADDGVDAFLVDGEDVEGIAAHLGALAEDPARVADLRAAALRKAGSFSVERAAAAQLELFAAAVDARRR